MLLPTTTTAATTTKSNTFPFLCWLLDKSALESHLTIIPDDDDDEETFSQSRDDSVDCEALMEAPDRPHFNLAKLFQNYCSGGHWPRWCWSGRILWICLISTLLFLLLLLFALLFTCWIKSSWPWTTNQSSKFLTAVDTQENSVVRPSPEILRALSRQTWSDLNEKNFSEESIMEIPSSAVLTSVEKRPAVSLGDSNNVTFIKKRGNCCKARKYVETVTSPGCEEQKVVNRICEGNCVSVWIPGVFASFPACKPSRSHWKTVTLECGVGQPRRRVRILKIRRCSCMEEEAEAL